MLAEPRDERVQFLVHRALRFGVATRDVRQVEELAVNVPRTHHPERATEDDGVQHRAEYLLRLKCLAPKRRELMYLAVHRVPSPTTRAARVASSDEETHSSAGEDDGRFDLLLANRRVI